MSVTELTIGELAQRTGCKVQTIRYYEQIGLMPAPPRTRGNQRRYSDDHVQRLAFVRHARDLGFAMETVATLLALAGDPDRPCKQITAIAEANLGAVRSRISKLRALERELKRMIASCGGRMMDCRIIEALGGPRLRA